MNFTITEAEVIRQTGYSRQQLQFLRLGRKLTKGDKQYEYQPELEKGSGWVQFGNRAVFYSQEAVEKLKSRKKR